MNISLKEDIPNTVYLSFAYAAKEDGLYLVWLNNVLNTLKDLNKQMKQFDYFFDTTNNPMPTLEDAKNNSKAFKSFVDFIVEYPQINESYKLRVDIVGEPVKANTTIGMIKKVFTGRSKEIISTRQLDNIKRNIDVLIESSSLRESNFTVTFKGFMYIVHKYLHQQSKIQTNVVLPFNEDTTVGGKSKARTKKATSQKTINKKRGTSKKTGRLTVPVKC